MLLIAAAPAQAAFPGENGRIAYTDDYPDFAGPQDINIHTINPDGTEDQPLTAAVAGDDIHPAWSPDGKRIVFGSDRDGNREIYVMNADGTNQTRLTNHPAADETPAWSPDGTAIVFASARDGDLELHTMNADGTGIQQLTIDPAADTEPAWSPDGTRIAFARGPGDEGRIFAMDADGSDVVQLTFGPNSPFGPTDERRPNWSPSGHKIVWQWVSDCDGEFETSVLSMNPDGTEKNTLISNCEGDSAVFNRPSWSPDGTKVLHGGFHRLETMNPDGSGNAPLFLTPVAFEADWQPIVHKEFPRPKGATPLYTSLVLAYKPCFTPNRVHGPPLAHDSCSPTVPKSSNVTIGTPDANGAAANFRGFIRMDALVGIPSTPADEADVRIHASLEDVRCYVPPVTPCGALNGNGGNDYAGELVGAMELRLTDEHNAPFPDPVTGAGPGTMQDTSVAFVIPCASTPATTVGGACSTTTTADALIPGMVREKDRAIWQLGQVLVFDGGPDASASTAPGTEIFLVQGVHIP